VSIFGESHGPSIGVIVNGLPAGEPVDELELQDFLDRRRAKDGPKSGPQHASLSDIQADLQNGLRNDPESKTSEPEVALSTKRREEDKPLFLSGLKDNKTTGSPLCAVIANKDARSSDYEALQSIPRPSHADYAAFIKWGGAADMRGGGHFSGRLTAPLCVAGGIAKQVLARRGIHVGAHLFAVAGIADEAFPLRPDAELFSSVARKSFPVINDLAGEKMQEAIRAAAKDRDSVGGVIECEAIGAPAGLGSPMFEGVENRLAAALFGIPAVKGVEFGDGFASASQRGSEHNDPFTLDSQRGVTMEKNSAGGINGGITNGMPLLLRVAIKPTPSIGRPQQSVDLSRGEIAELQIEGRHDPCIAHRAVPVVEAVTALVLLDLLLEEQGYAHQ
jgi:chorismate synthase